MLAPQTTFWRNLRDLPSALSLSSVVAGLVIVLVGYTGPLLIVLQAAKNGGLTDAQTASWLWAITVGNGVVTVWMSLYYRQPLIGPWPTAGAALLVTSLTHFSLPQAVGAYMLAGLATVLLGWSGWFGRALAFVPQPIVMGMLAGVLLRFGIGIFTTLPERPLVVVAMMAVFFVLRRFQFRAPTLGALIVGFVLAAVSGDMHLQGITLVLTVPQITLPYFTAEAALSLALPLFVLAISGQYAPGEAVLRASGYEPPLNGILIMTGSVSMVFAFFGGHGQSLGALTAAMVTNADAHPDPTKRYSASIASGVGYAALGLFGATVVSFFQGFPGAVMATIAGLALSGTIASSLTSAMSDPKARDAALIAFLCAAANFSLFNIGAPFWGLVAGVAVYGIGQYQRGAPKG